jgi:POT family proton-dependent oligopeptide transporter
VLVVLGTGLLKPNVSTIVGGLYPDGGARRDAGFTLFYMGINLGALIGPFVCSALGEKVNWHYGFGAAGVGMVCGLIQYRLTRHHLGEAGASPIHSQSSRRDWILFAGGLTALLFVITAVSLGLLKIDPIALAHGTTYVIVGLAALYFLSVLVLQRLTTVERKRVAVIAVLFVASALFWSGFEQAGSSLTLFAERYTSRQLAGFEVPTGWFQMINPGYIILLAPAVAGVWVALARRNINPSMPVKFGLGLGLLGLGFLVVAAGAKIALDGDPVWPTWLLTTYFLHSVGELCLSPVGLSSVTKLSPKRLVGQMMGVWFLATSLGNLIAGLFAGEVSGAQAGQMPLRFVQVALLAGGAALVLFLLAKPIQRLMGGVR